MGSTRSSSISTTSHLLLTTLCWDTLAQELRVGGDPDLIKELLSFNINPHTIWQFKPHVIIQFRWPCQWLVLHREYCLQELIHPPPEISPVHFVFTQKCNEHAQVKPTEGHLLHPFIVEGLELYMYLHSAPVEDQVVQNLKACNSPSWT
jgi:hypothetical protein